MGGPNVQVGQKDHLPSNRAEKVLRDNSKLSTRADMGAANGGILQKPHVPTERAKKVLATNREIRRLGEPNGRAPE
jgi:hypothetical protein